MKNKSAILLLLLANSVSGVAQGISMLAIPWYFTSIIHREGLFGQMYFVVTVVSLMWGLYAGTIVDRYDRRKLFLAINLAGGFVMSAIAITGFALGSLHWIFVAMSFANTVFIYNIHFPNLYAYAQEITSKEDYHSVTSTIEIQGQITFTLAGGIAAIMLSGLDNGLNLGSLHIPLPFVVKAWKIHEIFAIDAVTYFISFFLISRIQSMQIADKKVDTGSLYERLKTGITFLRKHILLFHFGNVSLLLFLTILLNGTFIMPLYVEKFLHKGADVYALGDMAFSFGAMIAGLVSTRIFAGKELKGIILLNFIAAALYAVLMFNTNFPLFFLISFVIGSCNAAVRIQRITYIFTHTPNRIIGRSGSIFFMVNVIERLLLIAAFSMPFFHSNTNIIYAVGILSLICLFASVFLTVKYKALQEFKTVNE